MDITFYGGAREVGRSAILLESERKNLLLDAGIKLGKEIEFPLIPDEKLKEIKNISITHAHLDHSGYLPHIINKTKHKINIYMTKPTRDLIGVLLADYLKIQKLKNQAKFTINDVNKLMKEIKIKEYKQWFRAGFLQSFRNAGHILGSAMVLVKSNNKRILYTGDINLRQTNIMQPAEMNIKADTLITESTYGGKNDIHPSTKESLRKIVKSINETIHKGGHVLIPTFAVGRGQELLLSLENYMRSGALEKVPIYIDGMLSKAMRIYRQNVIYANESIKMRILTSSDDPFKSKFFHVPRTLSRNDVFKRPSIIISTSGMLVGGPSVMYLKRMASNPLNKLIIIGYQAKGTLGREILDGAKKIKIDDEEIELKMSVEKIKFSGHADRNELLKFIKSIRGLKKIYIVHGEKCDELKDALENKYEVVVPNLLETFKE